MNKRNKKDHWVRIFEVKDPIKHKKGYTLYKVISKVFPENSYEAVTEICVWRRYNDFKKLYKALRTIHQNLHLPGTFPLFAKARFFGRFTDDVIEERRQSALALLEFVAQSPPLFNSQVFVKFFEGGQIIPEEEAYHVKPLNPEHAPSEPRPILPKPQPVENERAALGDEFPQKSTDVSEVTSQMSDDDRTTFTDDSTYVSSLMGDDLASFDPVPRYQGGLPQKIEGDNWLLSALAYDPNKAVPKALTESPPDIHFPHPFAGTADSSPVASLEDLTDEVLPADMPYLVAAAELVSQACLAEANGSPTIAYNLYKKAVEVLLQNVQMETSHKIRENVTWKIREYLNKAEELQVQCLAEKNNIVISRNEPACESPLAQLRSQEVDQGLHGPISDLRRYKVIGVTGSVLLALDTVANSTVAIKAYYKSIAPQDIPNIVPQGVHFMVALHRVYETECAVYLVLQHASGGRLWDYVASYLHSSLPESREDTVVVQESQESSATAQEECAPAFVELLSSYSQLQLVGHSQGDIEGKSLEPPSNSPQPRHTSPRLLSKFKKLIRKPPPSSQPYSSLEEEATPTEEHKRVDELFSHLDQMNKAPPSLLPTSSVALWGAEMVMALGELHQMGLVIRDLRPDNILLGDGGHVLLSYQSRWNCVDHVVKPQALDQLYAAPEVLHHGTIGPACDWWSLGALLYELLTGKSLFSSHPGGFHSHTRLQLPSHLSSEARDLLSKLLRYDPVDRLGFASTRDVKSHAFFLGVDWSRIHLS